MPASIGQAHAAGRNNIESLYDISKMPSTLSKSETKIFEDIFSAIDTGNWETAKNLINKADNSPMKYMALAEYYLAANSPRAEPEDLQKLLSKAPYLPQAEQISRLAQKRGVADVNYTPKVNKLFFAGSSPRRTNPKSIVGDNASGLKNQILDYIKSDQPQNAENLFRAQIGTLSQDSISELRQRISWSYYIENDDVSANRLANETKNVQNEWDNLSHWVIGLSSWRLGKYSDAFAAFEIVAANSADEELRSAAYYWASRAATASRQPEKSMRRLQAAAQAGETFYGQLASEALGLSGKAVNYHNANIADNKNLKNNENVNIAIGLKQIGRDKLADETLRHQGRIGDSEEFPQLAKLAGELSLPQTQLYFAHYAPNGQKSDNANRYPTVNWQPEFGWRVDKSLVFAHTLQESQWRPDVVSPAGAQGLMQIMPGTAQYMNRSRPELAANGGLNKPSVNLEYGQSYLEYLRDNGATEGFLPKVIAAYNAGLSPVSRWNSEVNDQGDPLLFMESIPYWETRGYVMTVMRNYWVYQEIDGVKSDSRMGIAQYLWPSFPAANANTKFVRKTGGSASIAAR